MARVRDRKERGGAAPAARARELSAPGPQVVRRDRARRRPEAQARGPRARRELDVLGAAVARAPLVEARRDRRERRFDVVVVAPGPDAPHHQVRRRCPGRPARVVGPRRRVVEVHYHAQRARRARKPVAGVAEDREAREAEARRVASGRVRRVRVAVEEVRRRFHVVVEQHAPLRTRRLEADVPRGGGAGRTAVARRRGFAGPPRGPRAAGRRKHADVEAAAAARRARGRKRRAQPLGAVALAALLGGLVDDDKEREARQARGRSKRRDARDGDRVEAHGWHDDVDARAPVRGANRITRRALDPPLGVERRGPAERARREGAVRGRRQEQARRAVRRAVRGRRVRAERHRREHVGPDDGRIVVGGAQGAAARCAPAERQAGRRGDEI